MNYWDRTWANFDVSYYKKYINPSRDYVFIDYFRKFGVKTVCDIGCGFGRYSAVLGYHQFEVYGIDISDYAIKITEEILKSLGLTYRQFKKCEMTNIQFEDNMFDGVTAHAVIDHLTLIEAQRSINEISRIVKPNGLVYISFDGLSDEDIDSDHETLEDGSMVYKNGDREGLLFRYYEDNEIEQLLNGYTILYFGKNNRGDRDIIYQITGKAA